MIQPGSLTHCSGGFCYVLASINILFAALTIPENIIVLVSLKRLSKGNKWKIPNVLMASLASTDLLSGCISQSLYGYFLLKQGELFSGDQIQGLDIWLLLVLNYSSYTLCGASLLIVAIMSIDRLLAIARPIAYKANMYRRRAFIALVSVTVFCLFIPVLRFTSERTVPVFTYIIAGIIASSLLLTFAAYIALICIFQKMGTRADGRKISVGPSESRLLLFFLSIE